ncbi:MAG TPA: sigma factor-like helix-turn-helix DNA-binding protein, partial [Verrucomicrobiae bacterium]|nr:sigma factor-like helix-turn-helix DNA-binding protein [Verrucomicrobiae bacterium]
ADTLKMQRRRQLREQESQMQSMFNQPDPNTEAWSQIAPLLEEALNSLGEKEHDAVVLRFFDGKELKAVGAALGTGEDAARMRVNRGLEKLRKFFSKRGVTISTSAIAAAVAAHSVQAAPAGLAGAVTSGTLSGSAITTTAVVAATKIIAMNTLQKIAVSTALVVAVGAGLHEARQAANARVALQHLQAQQEPLNGQVRQLTDERDALARQLASMREEKPGRPTNELLKLRGEVARLRNEAGQPSEADPVGSTARAWINRVAQLRQRLEQNPQARIPELRLLSEEDWLGAVKGHALETETDYRRALSAVRNVAESEAGDMLFRGLREYARANEGHFPGDLSQLAPFLDPAMDPAILDRWKVADKGAAPSIGVGDSIVTQKAPVDNVFDNRLVIGLNGRGATDFLQDTTREVLAPVMQAYREAHNGQWQSDYSQLAPYASTAEQQAALQSYLLKYSPSPAGNKGGN